MVNRNKVWQGGKKGLGVVDAKKEYEPCSDSSSGDETLSEESIQESYRDAELSGSRFPSGLDRMICPGSRCQDNPGTEFCPGTRET